MSFAKISIIGNLGADPELKYTADGKPRLEMRVATNERRKAAGAHGRKVCCLQRHQLVSGQRLRLDRRQCLRLRRRDRHHLRCRQGRQADCADRGKVHRL
jgi:hypothetical protein